MSNDLYHYNENVTFNVDRCEFAGSKLIISGWIFAQLPISKVNFSIRQERVIVGPIKSYGFPSGDVERHYGPDAANCRFSEILSLPSTFSSANSLIFELHFITGHVREMTFRLKHNGILELANKSDPQRKIKLGIGVTTYKRKNSLRKLLEKLYLHTQTPFDLVVADDGSDDGTIEMLSELNVSYITGVNRGIAWNKNRALYYLNSALACDVTILLEDDTYPSLNGWEEDWVSGAQQYNHLNLAGHWFKERFISGLGTVENPIICNASSGQCVSFSRKAIERVGYFDTRFGRYGFEHIEHTERCVELGYGGKKNISNGSMEYFLIRGGVTVAHLLDFHFASLIPQNAPIYEMVKRDELHRWAWRGNEEMKTFLTEQDLAVIARAESDHSGS